MLPQPDADILHANPQFAVLWKDLSRTKLCDNGVSRSVAEAKEARLRRDALQKKRENKAERQGLTDAIRWVGYHEDGGVDDELRETVQIVSAQLDGKLSSEDKDIVEVEVEDFMTNIDAITAAVERHMEQNVALLCQILDPLQEKSTSAQSLPTNIQSLQTELAAAKQQINSKRIELAGTLTSVLQTNAELLQTAIRTLEQVVHGSVGRHTRARAEHLATVARGLEKRLLVARKNVAGQVYDARVEEKLRGKREEVDARTAAMRRKIRDREQWLERLESVAGLREAVNEMEGLKSEIERMKDEVERLEGGS